MNGRSKHRAKICTVVEVGVDLLPVKDAETVFGPALGRDNFLLFKVTVGVLLVLVAVVALLSRGSACWLRRNLQSMLVPSRGTGTYFC